MIVSFSPEKNNDAEKLRCEGFGVMWIVNNTLLSASFVRQRTRTPLKFSSPPIFLSFFFCHFSSVLNVPEPHMAASSTFTRPTQSLASLVPSWFLSGVPSWGREEGTTPPREPLRALDSSVQFSFIYRAPNTIKLSLGAFQRTLLGRPAPVHQGVSSSTSAVPATLSGPVSRTSPNSNFPKAVFFSPPPLL